MHSMAEHGFWEGNRLYAPDLLKVQKLSVHAMILPDGNIITCCGLDREAFHAGKSSFQGLTGLNATFLGAEFLVSGEHDYGSFLKRIKEPDCYTEDQYRAGGWLYASWKAAYGFPDDHIVGHSEVAGDDMRGPGQGKKDPGAGFDRAMFLDYLHQWEAALSPRVVE